MNYSEALSYLSDIQKYGVSLNLDNMKNLCAELSNPEKELCVIHIAGTNGKGSVGTFCESILIHAGYNVCRYSSPAVMEYEEIFRYNGENITKAELADCVTKVECSAEAIYRSGEPHPTRFEVETAVAFVYCRNKNCDFAILETGMGGRLDAVNTIEKSRVSVLTSISLDHTAFLGDSIEKIAYEKAGIIKENGCVITAPQTDSVMNVIQEACREKNARLTIAGTPENISKNSFDYDDMRDVKISLKGAFQPQNAAVAIEVCSELGISEESIRYGLFNTVWHGRFEVISENPPFVIDGAHNADAARRLLETIKTEFPSGRINYIMGVLRDKDYEKIAELTAPAAERIYTITPDNPRALDAAVLADAVRKFNKNTAPAALNEAVRACMKDKDSVTVAFGSLSYLKDVVKAVRDEQMR